MQATGVGQSGRFHWWEGVVEDNLDPKGAGRCKVRVIAHNSPLKSEIATQDLPWAYPMMPLNNPHGKIVALKSGTRVTGYYRDGLEGQDLVMMGTINTGYESPGQFENFNEEVPPFDTVILATAPLKAGDVGFVDDRVGAGSAPIPGQPAKTYVIPDGKGGLLFENITDYGPLKQNEINTPRLARGIHAETITEAHMASVATITSPAGKVVMEPSNPYAAQYPFNTVEESDSGHYKEIDDTPGAERIKESHRTGTYHEIHPDGTMVTKVIGDDWSVSIRDKNVKIQGVCNVEVDGEAKFYCHGNIAVKSDGSADIQALSSVKMTALGSAEISSLGSTTVGGKAYTTVGSQGVLELDGGITASLSGGAMTSISADGFIVFKDATGTDVGAYDQT